MSRVRLILLAFLAFAVAGCGKKETTEQQQPPAVQPAPAPSQPAPESTPQVTEAQPEPTPAVPSQPEATRKSKSTSPAKQAPARKSTAMKESHPESAATPPAANAVAPARSAVEPAAPPKPQFVIIPSGASIHVRLQDALDSAVNQPGDTFTAILDRDIEADGKVAAPRGSILKGKLSNVARSGRVEGRASMSMQLTSIQIGEQSYPIQTGILSFEAESTKKKDATKIGVGAGIGAVIGAIAGGGKGAAIGAAVGGGAGGATVLATRGKEIKFDSEHKLDFALTRDVSVKLQ